MLHCEMLIDGHFIGGPCDQSVGKTVIKNPFDGTVVGTAAEGGLQELRTCVDAAHDAFANWRFSPPQQRESLLRRIAVLVRERADELSMLLTKEVGKPITWSRGEVARLAITFDAAADEVRHLESESVPLDLDPRGTGYTCRIRRFPIGVIFAIVPYNWPFNLTAHKIAPALASGNTIVVKPSPLAPLSTLTLARLIHEAGCPPGVLNAWHGEPHFAEKVLVDDARIRMLSFTGSAKVGWHLKGLLPDRKVTLELGGNAYAIVCPDADLQLAAERIIAGAYGYAGQICISIQHVLAHVDIASEFRNRLIEGTGNCPTGDPVDPNTVCGPMISSEAADKVQEMIQQSGGTTLVGGSRNGNVLSPTLVEGIDPQSLLAREEAFGPVLTFDTFVKDAEAVQQVNRSSYGIHTGVFTKDKERIGRYFYALEVGGVVIDDYPTLRFDNVPYGGVKRSGFGREGVRYAIEEMTEWKSLTIRTSSP